MQAYINAYLGLLVATLISYSIFFSKKEQYVKMVILLMVVWLLSSIIALYFWGQGKNNLIVFHILAPVEYAVLSMLYKAVIVSSRVKKLIILSIPVFAALAVLFAMFVQKTDTNNSQIVIIESVVMIFLSLFFLRETLLLQQITVLYRYPMFWISVGLLVYFTGQMLIEGLLNHVMKYSMELARRLYMMEFIFKYLLFVLFIIGAFCSKKYGGSVEKLNR